MYLGIQNQVERAQRNSKQVQKIDRKLQGKFMF